jgi:hypothetical protein
MGKNRRKIAIKFGDWNFNIIWNLVRHTSWRMADDKWRAAKPYYERRFLKEG